MPNIAIQQTNFSDFEALRHAVQGAPAPIDIVQVERGEIAVSLTHLAIGSLGLSTVSFSRGVRARGVLSESRWTLGMLFDAPGLLQTVESAPGDLVLTAPNFELYASYPSANRFAAVYIPENELFAFLEGQRAGASNAGVWRRPTSVLTATDPTASATTAAQFATLLGVLTKHGDTLSADAVDFYRRNVMELITAPVLERFTEKPPRLSLRDVRLVQDVERYLDDAGARPVHISELSEAFGVHRRTLHRAFSEVMGIAPISFMRRKRLGEVHEALLQSGPAALIATVAIEHGFADLSRFSAAYHRMFGELPSQTLRRTRATTLAIAVISYLFNDPFSRGTRPQALEHRHATTTQTSRDNAAALIVPLAPGISIAAALGSDPASVPVDCMGEADDVDCG
jgi:AraC-like DNA-binding protein